MHCMPETMPKALGGCYQSHLKDEKAEVQYVNALVKVTQPAEPGSDLELCDQEAVTQDPQGCAGATGPIATQSSVNPQEPCAEGLWSVGAGGVKPCQGPW